MTDQFFENLETIMDRDCIFQKEMMKNHTTFRVGGPADVLLKPKGAELGNVIKLCGQEGVPFCVIGNGSNLLVGDKGIRGVVIEMASGDAPIRIAGDTLRASAGAMLSKAASAAAEAGLSGLEFAAGIPGTVGGAIVMNAGAYGGEIKDVLESVRVIGKHGEEKELAAGELGLGYRKSNLPDSRYIVTEAVMRLARGERGAILEKMNALKEQRREKQPLEHPSAGSTFKRPEGHFAGQLIMEAGLRGYQVGGARISDKHCGFVINCGEATALDILRLIQEVTEKVERRSGITLEPEVRLLGEF